MNQPYEKIKLVIVAVVTGVIFGYSLYLTVELMNKSTQGVREVVRCRVSGQC